jgi:hypothetical protein
MTAMTDHDVSSTAWQEIALGGATAFVVKVVKANPLLFRIGVSGSAPSASAYTDVLEGGARESFECQSSDSLYVRVGGSGATSFILWK